MNSSELIQQARSDGVGLALTADGTLKARGNRAIVNRWLPVIRENKAELLSLLTNENQSATVNPPTVSSRRDPDGARQQAQVSRPATPMRTDELLKVLRTHKQALMQMLKTE
jgi:hypothetical protein